MPQFLALALGFVIGAALAWFISGTRARASMSSRLGERDAQVAAAEARGQEVRLQLDSATSELKTLREDLTKGQAARAAAEAGLSAAEKNVADQKELLIDAKAKLSETFRSLAAEALAGNNEGFVVLAEQKFKAFQAESFSDLEGPAKSS